MPVVEQADDGDVQLESVDEQCPAAEEVSKNDTIDICPAGTIEELVQSSPCASVIIKEEVDDRVIEGTPDVRITEGTSNDVDTTEGSVELKKSAIESENSETVITTMANSGLNGHSGGGGGGSDAQPNSKVEEDTDGWVDVIGSGDLMKKVMRKGRGIDSRPQRGDIVHLNITGKLPDGRHVEVGHNVEVTIGDAEVIQGLDLALPLMELDEISEVVVKPRLAYGKLGKDSEIPPNVTIAYTLELLSIEDEPDVKVLPYPVRTKIGNRKNERGNFWFGRGEYSSALQCYRRALEFLDEESESTSDISNELKELLENRIKVYNNMAAAQMKIGAFDAAMTSVNNVLNVQPTNVKALFRKGKILESMGQTVEAITTLKDALNLEPEARIIHHELSKLAEKQKYEERAERELYRRMLGQDKRQPTNDSDKTKKRSSGSVFVKWGFVAGGLTFALGSVAAYRYFHGM